MSSDDKHDDEKRNAASRKEQNILYMPFNDIYKRIVQIIEVIINICKRTAIIDQKSRVEHINIRPPDIIQVYSRSSNRIIAH